MYYGTTEHIGRSSKLLWPGESVHLSFRRSPKPVGTVSYSYWRSHGSCCRGAYEMDSESVFWKLSGQRLQCRGLHCDQLQRALNKFRCSFQSAAGGLSKFEFSCWRLYAQRLRIRSQRSDLSHTIGRYGNIEWHFDTATSVCGTSCHSLASGSPGGQAGPSISLSAQMAFSHPGHSTHHCCLPELSKLQSFGWETCWKASVTVREWRDESADYWNSLLIDLVPSLHLTEEWGLNQ